MPHRKGWSGAFLAKRHRIQVSGRVQGVGFRPAVYRIAQSLGLSGFVLNDSQGVTIELQGPANELSKFLDRLQRKPDKPPLSRIDSATATEIPIVPDERGVAIKSSEAPGNATSQVTADIAICGQCLDEMRDDNDFRHAYPFINCTNCGPRYSIVKTIPYDRPNTTMAPFEMCDRCAEQYEDVMDRRFHAQPVACPECGPTVWLTDNEGQTIRQHSAESISEAACMLKAGKVVAIKGVGGFHLAVDAFNEQAVQILRQRKRRDHKPFALMAASLSTIHKYADVNEETGTLLKSPESPIVLLPRKKGTAIAPSVAQGVGTLGFVLCYAPLHYLLFAQDLDVLVMTSGNISDEPLICSNEKALERLGSIADAFLMHNREIYRQVDDSILHMVGGRPIPLRRARGYVPTPILLETAAPQEIFAAGADMKNTFSFIKGNQLICSEHIGDIEDAEVFHHYVGSIEHLRRLFEVEPEVVACDLHPGYFSARHARSLNKKRLIEVQHHWAHIGCALSENLTPGPVIGIVCDGTGYGVDGAVWGCECLIASLTDFQRFGHLDYYPLAGGNRASKEPIRPLLALLSKAYGRDFALESFQWLLSGIEPDVAKQQVILNQIDKEVNTVNTSSLGRVFDAVAAALGMGAYNHFDAQLPMALEASIEESVEDRYDFELVQDADDRLVFRPDQMIRQLVNDIRAEVQPGVASAKFHNTLAAALCKMSLQAQEHTDLTTVALGGGVFCNRYLANRLIRLLKEDGFNVLLNRNFPTNDGDVSVGQAAIAAAIISQA